eukprot:CAMPEP_0204494692 /NCGR_PEP_ID=MMETSP0471-20130131/84863_1 /ASSEMBLY_ACC=CAM_ASM_000602 /TAXON_ID=2969 /ORGANISM="Oxyrrhis marina" /LENGTH=60 /DNA_ID=CAMNT_0051498899 /DNA_START=131 /DNA_END=310 /DNA_ORIENTATION=+
MTDPKALATFNVANTSSAWICSASYSLVPGLGAGDPRSCLKFSSAEVGNSVSSQSKTING